MSCKCKKKHAQTTAPQCVYRGQVVRRVLCRECNGRVWQKVFACGVRGEALIFDCNKCNERAGYLPDETKNGDTK